LGDCLAEHGYELLLAVAETPERERRAIEAVLGRRPEGIVLTGNEHPPETLALLASAETPVVETWILGDPIIDMAAGFSLTKAGYAIGSFLTGRGYRHIGFAGYAPASQRRFLERQVGFQVALKHAGLRDDLLFYAEEVTGFAGGRAAVAGLLEQEPRLDALFCVTDIFAAGALFECQRRGLSVPGQLAVVGFGDFEIAAEIVPALTTVRTRGYEIGQAAGRLILDRAAGAAPGQRIDVGFELVSRESA
jgi:LacI family gluconate utilization system Gnt-I transcriptional repressor